MNVALIWSLHNAIAGEVPAPEYTVGGDIAIVEGRIEANAQGGIRTESFEGSLTVILVGQEFSFDAKTTTVFGEWSVDLGAAYAEQNFTLAGAIGRSFQVGRDLDVIPSVGWQLALSKGSGATVDLVPSVAATWSAGRSEVQVSLSTVIGHSPSSAEAITITVPLMEKLFLNWSIEHASGSAIRTNGGLLFRW